MLIYLNLDVEIWLLDFLDTAGGKHHARKIV
jgi:hypothetical protein